MASHLKLSSRSGSGREVADKRADPRQPISYHIRADPAVTHLNKLITRPVYSSALGSDVDYTETPGKPRRRDSGAPGRPVVC